MSKSKIRVKMVLSKNRVYKSSKSPLKINLEYALIYFFKKSNAALFSWYE